ncbi:MAG: SUMF1/EgtB/PvdO family nonheme iron enzyme [Elusimicrobia bacterium]|jgi:formylglycine-generating enzyme required for sulfatase activity|nr:SUMF1/EgtB/PvdO family nonheme iron enzyme [Elusimicrobiota bacterium]
MEKLTRPCLCSLALLSCAALLAAAPAPEPAASAGIQWVRIPGGSFKMGAEGPAQPGRRVRVASFDMAKSPVTNQQYQACVKARACTPAHASDGTCYVFDGERWKPGKLAASFLGDEQPVVCVDWKQAAEFSAWAGGRLPSEAEWEYAARGAGRAREYPWGGKAPDCERAVMDDKGRGCGRNATWPVCSKPKGDTRQGLCDMAGNVWQWAADLESPAGTRRVGRGGAWHNGARFMRVVDRGAFDPAVPVDDGGFRPVRSAPSPER